VFDVRYVQTVGSYALQATTLVFKGSFQNRRYLRVGYIPGANVKNISRKLIKRSTINNYKFWAGGGGAFRKVAGATNFPLFLV